MNNQPMRECLEGEERQSVEGRRGEEREGVRGEGRERREKVRGGKS